MSYLLQFFRGFLKKKIDLNSEIPAFTIWNYDKNTICQKRIKSAVEISYKTTLKRGLTIKDKPTIESKNCYDKHGNKIESYFMNYIGKHGQYCTYEYDGNSVLKKERLYTKEKKLISTTTYSYNKSGKVVELNKIDGDSNLKRREIYKYSDNDELLEKIVFDENSDIIDKIINQYNHKGNKTKTEEIRNQEVSKSIIYSYDSNSNLIKKIENSSSFGTISIKNYRYNTNNKLMENSRNYYSSEYIYENLKKYNSDGNKMNFFECYNDYIKEEITSKIETYLYDENKKIREIANINGFQKYSFYTNRIEEMRSIHSGNIMWDLKGNIRKCVFPKQILGKTIQYFDEDGFETEIKRYDLNDVFLDSEKFDKAEKKETHYDSIKTYDEKGNLIREVGYMISNNERLIVERTIEYHDGIETKN